MTDRTAEFLAESLSRAGVKRVYGVMGDSLGGFIDSFRRSKTIEWVHMRHEEGAAFAAGAEAHLTGQLAVCAASCEPGNLHLINALLDCQRSSFPVLAIAIHIPSMEIDVMAVHPESLFRDCSHYVALVSSPALLPQILARAMRVAVTKRGVSVVVVPGEVALERATERVPDRQFPARPIVRPNDSARCTLVRGDRGADFEHQPTLSPQATSERLRVAVVEMFNAVRDGLQGEGASARRCLERVVIMLGEEPWFARSIAKCDVLADQSSRPLRNGLAAWQIERLTAYVEEQRAAKIQIKDLATIVNLSSAHFSRVFKRSFADTPNRYVMRRRVELAKSLMLSSNATLGRIAADCGFSDQAHFNKQFRQFVGVNPSAWRRARQCDARDTVVWMPSRSVGAPSGAPRRSCLRSLHR